MHDQNIAFAPSSVAESMEMIGQHARALSCPMDSFLENRLCASQIIAIRIGDAFAGYAAILEDQVHYFYVADPFFPHASLLLSRLLTEYRLDKLFVITQDSRLMALLTEWEYEVVEKRACFFVDAGRTERPASSLDRINFRLATRADEAALARESGSFYRNLAERIDKQEIFLLEEDGELLGSGQIEPGRIFTDCLSIGMITSSRHRGKGVAKTILWHLKEWAYANRLKPIAGCWYYNTLSRKSLEAVGLIPTGKAFSVRLIGREEVPLRTIDPFQ